MANGEPVELAEGSLLPDLIDALHLGTRWVVAEVNGEAVPRRQMTVLRLFEGDRVELVRAVAGG